MNLALRVPHFCRCMSFLAMFRPPGRRRVLLATGVVKMRCSSLGPLDARLSGVRNWRSDELMFSGFKSTC